MKYIAGYSRKHHELYGTFLSWLAMRNRCNNPKAANFARYGGKGIRVCKRWSIFLNFANDMGKRPEGMTIHRINARRGYSPSNCRWATSEEQIEESDNHAKGWKRNRTHCPKGHEFNASNTKITTSGNRRCRECDNANARLRRKK